RACEPHLRRVRRAACALLHDGRVLRVSDHDRRRRQSAGLFGTGQAEHAHRRAARQARGRPMSDLHDTYDVAVVGAGPAGLAAATICARAGLATVLFDEQPAPGGQIYRSVTTTPIERGSVLGADYWAGAELAQKFLASGAHYVPGATVWNLTRE